MNMIEQSLKTPAERINPERAQQSVLAAASQAGCEGALQRAQQALSAEQYEQLRSELHQAVLDYYQATAYPGQLAQPETVPAFLRQAEPDEILQFATFLKSQTETGSANSQAA